MPKDTTREGVYTDDRVKIEGRDEIIDDDQDTEQEAPEPRQRQKSAREQVMEEIENKAAARSGKAAAPENEADDEPDEEPEDEPEAVDAADETGDSHEVGDEVPLHRGKDGRWYATRRVDGKTEDVPFEELLAINQKMSAADERLREAARQRSQLERYHSELSAYERRIIENAEKDAAVAKPKDKAELKALTKKYTEALFNGEDDQASDILAEILEHNATSTPTPQIDVKRIAADAAQQVRQENWQSELTKAVNRFTTDESYKDITQDTALWDMTDRHTAAIYRDAQRQGLSMSPQEIIDKAVEQTREWMKSKGLIAADDDFSAKRDKVRRAAASTPRGTGTRNVASAPKKQLTPSEEIREMRRRRGLPV